MNGSNICEHEVVNKENWSPMTSAVCKKFFQRQSECEREKKGKLWSSHFYVFSEWNKFFSVLKFFVSFCTMDISKWQTSHHEKLLVKFHSESTEYWISNLTKITWSTTLWSNSTWSYTMASLLCWIKNVQKVCCKPLNQSNVSFFAPNPITAIFDFHSLISFVFVTHAWNFDRTLSKTIRCTV
jgi:hypothetical protein